MIVKKFTHLIYVQFDEFDEIIKNLQLQQQLLITSLSYKKVNAFRSPKLRSICLSCLIPDAYHTYLQKTLHLQYLLIKKARFHIFGVPLEQMRQCCIYVLSLNVKISHWFRNNDSEHNLLITILYIFRTAITNLKCVYKTQKIVFKCHTINMYDYTNKLTLHSKFKCCMAVAKIALFLIILCNNYIRLLYV